MRQHLLRFNGIYYFRYVLSQNLIKVLDTHQYREIRLSLYTTQHVYAKELAHAYWLACRELSTVDLRILEIKCIETFKAHIRKSVMNHLPQQFTPLVELTGSTEENHIVAAIKVLSAYHADFFVMSSPSLRGGIIHKYRSPSPQFPKGRYEAIATANGQVFPPLQISSDLVNNTLMCDVPDMLPERLYYTVSGEKFMLMPPEYYTVHLHQLFVKADLPQHISATVRKLTERPATITAVPQAPAISSSPKLSEVMGKYCEYKKKKWIDKTTDEFVMHLQTFIKMIGDKEVLQITNDDCSYYINQLPRIPLNFSKNPLYRGRSLKEVLAMPDQPEVLAPKTVKQYFGTVRGFFKYAKIHYDINTVLLQLSPETNERDNEKNRVPFSRELLSTIFESDAAITYLKTLFQNYQVWIAPLGLYTGARLGEICGLRLDDIGEEDGITYVQFNDAERKDKTRKGKTRNAVRRIPMHNQLIQLGFLNFVEQMRKGDPAVTQGRLFPECTFVSKHGYRKKASRWFGDFLDLLGIVGEEYVFHSWRHTASTKFHTTPNHPPDWMLDVYFGHKISKTESESVRSYLHERKVITLLPVLDTLKWDIDWTKYAELCARTHK